MTRTYRAPSTCPVCSDELITLRVGCPSCGTELSGHFAQCRYCSLDAGDVEVLEVFLRSRGNVRDVQAHLGVSYPTARQRLADLLAKMGLGEESAASVENVVTDEPSAQDEAVTAAVLEDLAAGRIDVDEAAALLGGSAG